MNQTIFRKIKVDDLPEIRQLLINEWYKEMDQQYPKAAHSYVHFDLNSCLIASNFGQVAVKNGQVVGIILGRDNENPKRLNHLVNDPHEHLLTLLDSPKEVTEQLVNYLKAESDAYDKMYNNASINYDGEIVLFITKKSVRGEGVGSKLFKSLLTHFDDVGVRSYYLYTDDSCNFGFYHHKGLHQRESVTADFGNNESYNFYLFDYIEN